MEKVTVSDYGYHAVHVEINSNCKNLSMGMSGDYEIAIASGAAFLTAQIIDVQIFDKLRKKQWFVAPLTSSIIGSTVDTFMFFLIAFYGTGINWVSLSLGDLAVKFFVAMVMLIPFRILMNSVADFSSLKKQF